jgi:two-component system sensor histidine kinase DesK
MVSVEDQIRGGSAADDLDEREGCPSSNSHVPPRLARLLMITVHGGFASLGVLNLLNSGHGAVTTYASAAFLALYFVLHVFHCSPCHVMIRVRDRYGRWTLTLQAILAFLPIPAHETVCLTGFLVGAELVVVRRRPLAWGLYGLTALAVLLLSLSHGYTLIGALSYALTTLILGLVVFGLTRLGLLAAEQRRLRDEAARDAVAEERERFVRDLHDLLGYSLSAITMKNELTYRLVGTDDDRAREELAETLRIARQALADVRAVVSGYSTLSLSEELMSVRGVLGAAGVQVTVVGSVREPEPPVGTMLAIVLREAVTNMLRHSQSTRCRIALSEHRGRVRMSVANDGVVQAQGGKDAAARRGAGLRNLTGRVRLFDGRLTSGVYGSWFHLCVECPRSRDREPAG